MSLSITINNIDDLTDAERAVLRLIVGDKQVTLTGPTATQQYLERLAFAPVEDITDFGKFAEPAADFHAVQELIEAERSGEVRNIRVSFNNGEVAHVLARVTKDADGKFIITPAAAPVTTTGFYVAACGHPVDEGGRVACDECSAAAARAVASSTVLRAPIPASAELDSDGLPWDKRIHSSSRNKLQDGTWRKLKGVDKDLVVAVEAELRAVQALPVPQTHGSPELDADAEKLEATAGAGAAGPTLADVLVAFAVLPVPVAPVVEAVIAVPSPDPDNRREAGEAVASVPVPPAPIVPASTIAEMQAALAAAEQHGVHGGEGATNPAPVSPAAPLTFAEMMKSVTPMLVSGKLSQDKMIAIAAEFGLPHMAALGARPDLVAAVKARIDAEVGNAAA